MNYIEEIKNNEELAAAFNWPIDFILTDDTLDELFAYSKIPCLLKHQNLLFTIMTAAMKNGKN